VTAKRKTRTPWYPGTVLPVRNGTYERRYHRSNKVYLDVFLRGVWVYWSEREKRLFAYDIQDMEWRGLRKPETSS
jgi:hypothetical protein